MNTIATATPRQVNPKSFKSQDPVYTLSHHSLTPPAMMPAKHPQRPANNPLTKQGQPTANAVSKPAMI